MSRLRVLAASLAQESGRSAAVIEYGLKVGLYNLAGFLGVIGVGLVLGVLPTALVAYVASGTLRLVSGGGHTDTPVRCILLTSLQFGVLGWAAHQSGPHLAGAPLSTAAAIVLAGLILAIVRFAPRDVPNKPISPARGRKLRKWAVAVWCGWLLLITGALSAEMAAELILAALLGLGLQALSLIPRSQPKQSSAGGVN